MCVRNIWGVVRRAIRTRGRRRETHADEGGDVRRRVVRALVLCIAKVDRRRVGPRMVGRAACGRREAERCGESYEEANANDHHLAVGCRSRDFSVARAAFNSASGYAFLSPPRLTLRR